jgi:intracellular septation protein A
VWFSFVLLGAFSVVSLNAMRVYISKNAISQGFVYGIFYGGVAIFSALGALIVGLIWSHFSFYTAVNFSIFGASGVALLFFLSTLFQQQKSTTIK